MADDADLLIRVGPRAGPTGDYPVELELGDGGRFPGGSLSVVPDAELAAVAADNAAYGKRLFDSLFNATVRPGYDRAIAAAAAAGGGVTVRLLVDPGATELEATRWERMFRDKNGTPVAFATAGDTPFSRYRASQAPEPRPVATRPIQVLLVVSSPLELPRQIGAPDKHLELVDVDLEVNTFRDAVAEAADRDDLDIRILVERRRLKDETAARLEQDGFRILDRRPTVPAFVRELLGTQIVHFVGHGIQPRSPDGGERRDAALLFERDGDDHYELFFGDAIVERFAAAEVAPSLVFLAACHSGETDPGPHAFVGIGPRLVDAGVGAVVAMQDAIAMDTARALTTAFYADVLESGVVDRALNHARNVVYRDKSADWSVPALFSRLRRGRLFVARDLANQVIADDVSLTPGPAHGVVARRLADVPQPRLRQMPVRLLPRDFPELIGREQQVATALDTIRDGSFIEFFGPVGIGKSVLLRHIANRVGDVAAAGVVHLRSGNEPIEDLLQFVFDALYEADASLRPTDADLRRHLAPCDPVIAVDDADLSREDLQALLDAVPKGRFLLASGTRNLWEGEVLELRELSAEAALALFEATIERPLTQPERDAAAAICAGLGGHPLHIVQAAAEAASGRWPTLPVGPAEAMAAPPASPALTPTAVPLVVPAAIAALSPEARSTLGLIAAAGAPLGPEHIEAILGLEDAGPVCGQLQEAGLIRSASPRYVLTEPLAPDVLARLNIPDLRRRLVAHLADWVEQNRNSPRRIVRDVDVLLSVLAPSPPGEDGPGPSADAATALRIAHGAESALILAKRWRRWQLLLDQELGIAHAASDEAAVAWALHQTGSRALALRDEATARRTLGEALRIRERLGDKAGAAVTRANLALLDLPPINPDNDDRSVSNGGPHVDPPPLWKRLRWLLGGGIVAAVAIVGLVIAVRPPNPPPIEHHAVPRFVPAAVEVGSVEIGSSAEATLKVANDGDADWLISTAVLEPEQSEITLSTDCPSSLTTDSTCTITVRFSPLAAGERTASIVVTDNSAAGRQAIPIHAIGVAPPGEPALAIDPGALEFDVVPPGETLTKTVTVSSVGTAALTIPQIDPIDSRDFGILAETCSTASLAPGTSCQVTVEFHPTVGGPLTATLRIEDSSSAVPHEVALTGSGRVSRADITLAFNDFGGRVIDDLGRVHVQIYATVRNVGEADAPPLAIAAQFVDPSADPAAQAANLAEFGQFTLVGAAGGLLRTPEPLARGGERFFSGEVIFPPTAQGHTVELTLVADPCPPLALATACEVDELDEDNNATKPVPLDLPGQVIFANPEGS